MGRHWKLSAALLAATALAACGGGDDAPALPAPDEPVTIDPPAPVTLRETVTLAAGDASCFQGGTSERVGADDNGDGALQPGEVDSATTICTTTALDDARNFRRIATFPVCRQIEDDCDDDDDTRAEQLAVTEDGLTLLYTDTAEEALGFVDITDPAAPQPLGRIELEDDPRAVVVVGNFALVVVDTSDGQFSDNGVRSGQLEVIDIATRRITRTIALLGEPDGLAVSPDGEFAAVAIENRFVSGDVADEDAGPPGELVVIDISATNPDRWTSRRVALTGLADINPSDPEPESVDINADNVAAVTLQDNNHIVLVDLLSASVVGDFSAGEATLVDTDNTLEFPAVVDFSDTNGPRRREPDDVVWINTGTLLTGDEGTLGETGGTRGFTVFSTDGTVLTTQTSEVERQLAAVGHYPVFAETVFGHQPETVDVAVFGEQRFQFVVSERGNAVLVYNAADPSRPVYKQALPTGVQPEGLLALPGRGLLFAASEEDDRDARIRAGVSIYSYREQAQSYPTLALPAPVATGEVQAFGGLSGLAAGTGADQLLAVQDEAFADSRVLSIDTSVFPALIDRSVTLRDTAGVLAATPVEATASDPERFDSEDLAALIGEDGTVNLDLEGVELAEGGGFWVVSEGNGVFDQTLLRPVTSRNFLIRADADGTIAEVVRLPSEIDAIQERFGFAGVARDGREVAVPFQREWGSEAAPRIGIWDTLRGTWRFVFYPLDAPESQNGGSVQIGDIAALGDGLYLVLETDNRAGPDAAVKRIYEIDTDGAREREVLTKTLRRDLIAEGDLTADGGLVLEKFAGLAVDTGGAAWIVNDDDALVDSSGEVQLIELGDIVP